MRLEAIRSIELVDILVTSGCFPDPSDKNNWKTSVGRITVTGQKFYCHDTGRGGGGAIDLTMLLHGTDFKGAVAWLSTEIGKLPIVENIRPRVAPEFSLKKLSTLPVPIDRHWSRVRHYLISTRCVSKPLVDKLHATGRIYADMYANVVFLLGNGEGAELRGTGPRKFHGVRGEKKPFILPGVGQLKVAFVESAIDAISLQTLGIAGEIVSLTGNSAVVAHELADKYRSEGYVVIAAFDADEAGDLMAENLGEHVVRLRPPVGHKDWNDLLRSKSHADFLSVAEMFQEL